MSKEEVFLLKFLGFFFFTIGLANIFLTIFLFRLGGFTAVITFGLTSLMTLFILYIFSGYMLKSLSTRALIRIGLFFSAVLYFYLLVLQERASSMLIPLGLINGIGAGFFWPGFNLSQYIATGQHTRHEYFGKQNFFINMGMAAGPILAGFIIESLGLIGSKNTGYVLIFLIVAVNICILLFHAKRLPQYTGISFSLSDIFKHRRQISWKIILLQQFLYGTFDLAFSAISAVLIFLILKGEFLLGFQNTLSTVIFALASILGIKVLKRYKHAYLFGALFGSLGLFLFAYEQNWLGIVSLLFITNIFLPLLSITTSKTLYDSIDYSGKSWKNTYHFLVERDTALGIGRIASYVCLLIFFVDRDQVAIAKMWIFLIPFIPLIIGFLQWYYFRRLKLDFSEAILHETSIKR